MLIRLDTGQFRGEPISFFDRTLWPVSFTADERETVVVQWR